MRSRSRAADPPLPPTAGVPPGVAVPDVHGVDLRLTVPALVAWVVGAVTLSWPVPSRFAVAGLAAAAGLWLWSMRVRGRGSAGPSLVVALTTASVALVTLASGALGLVRSAGPVADLAGQRATVTVVAVVTSDPIAITGSGRDRSTVLIGARVVRVEGRGREAAVSTPVLVRADERWRGVAWHSRVRTTGVLSPAEPGRPEAAVLRASHPPVVVAPPGPVARAAEHTRDGLRRATGSLPADAAGLLPALVIGDTSRTPVDLTDAMRATGLTHLSAVSGSNVAVTLAVALVVARMVGLMRALRLPWALLVLAGFVVLARPEPSVLRAAVMGAIGLLGLSRSRPAAGLPVLAAAVLALLVADPWLARSYGFALSTLATLGLLLFVRPWGMAIGRRLPRRFSGLGLAVAVPVAAQAMCAPVVVLLQGSVSVVGVLANLLAAPLVAPATILGVVAALVALVWPWGAALAAWLGAAPTLGIAAVARLFAQVPGGSVPWPSGSAGALLLAGITCVAILSGPWLASQVARRPLAAISSLVLAAAAVTPTATAVWPPARWLMVTCDVGQGDAIALATGPGRALLVDAGPEPAAVDRCLRRLGVGALDAIVLTHFHADHVDGLPGVGGRSVGEVLATPVGEPATQYAQVVRWVRQHGIPLRTLVAGDVVGYGAVRASVWWPARRIPDGSVPNNASVVLAARDGPLDVLLMGDIEREAAHQILLTLRRDPPMAAQATRFDAVKSTHHGSANLDPDLMWAVRAPVAIISVGADNDYGHPAPTHLATLRHDGSAVYRTDQRGDIALVDAGGGRVGVVCSES